MSRPGLVPPVLKKATFVTSPQLQRSWPVSAFLRCYEQSRLCRLPALIRWRSARRPDSPNPTFLFSLFPPSVPRPNTLAHRDAARAKVFAAFRDRASTASRRSRPSTSASRACGIGKPSPPGSRQAVQKNSRCDSENDLSWLRGYLSAGGDPEHSFDWAFAVLRSKNR